MSKIEVRKANESDLVQVVSIGEGIFPQEYNHLVRERSLTFFRDILKAHFDRMYVSQQDGNFLGFAIYKPQGLTDTHELFQIGVRKESQEQGVGTILLRESMEKYIEEMRQLGLGVYAIYLATAYDNPAGQNLYRKCGFEITGTLSDTYVGMGDRQVLMTKIFDRSRRYEPGTMWNPDIKKS